MLELNLGTLNDITVTSKASSEPTDIALPDIAPDPDQPRKEFDDDLIDTMATQMADPNIGQLEAIYVRANPAEKPPYLIVHGETRYRAAEKAKLETIRAVVTVDGGFIRQLLSNETRGDMSLLDKARAYNELIEHHGFDQKSVAELLGTDAANISRFLALLNMPAVVERAYNEGKATSLRVLDDLRKLVAAHPKSLDVIERFVSESDSITRTQIADLSKQLSKKKKKPSAGAAPKIGGKAFKVVSVKGDVMTIKRAGDKAPTQYRIVPIEQSA